MTGAYITILGALITIVLNIILIPWLHYTGAAIATFICYFTMMMVSYKQGKKYYPVPYATKKLSAYVILSVLIYLVHIGITKLFSDSLWFSMLTAAIMLTMFGWFVSKVEAKELARMGFGKAKSTLA